MNLIENRATSQPPSFYFRAGMEEAAGEEILVSEEREGEGGCVDREEREREGGNV